MKGSKTDQYNVGCVRNHYRANQPLCPVEALQGLQEVCPARFESEASLPLFRKQDGRVLTRSELTAALKWAAVATGGDPDRTASHSLRIGGATAMFQAGVEFPRIKRFDHLAERRG